jgi:hypothetical protein
MSSIQQLSPIVETVWSPSRSARSSASQDDAAASPAGAASDPASFPDQAFQAAVDRARLKEWVENVVTSDHPSSLLVQRPLPDGNRPTYPSAIEAYREVTELIPKL